MYFSKWIGLLWSAVFKRLWFHFMISAQVLRAVHQCCDWVICSLYDRWAVNIHQRQRRTSYRIVRLAIDCNGWSLTWMYYLQIPNRINELKAWVSQTRTKQGWAVTHNALPHLETAEKLEDDGNQKRSMYKDVEVTLNDAKCVICTYWCWELMKRNKQVINMYKVIAKSGLHWNLHCW